MNNEWKMYKNNNNDSFEFEDQGDVICDVTLLELIDLGYMYWKRTLVYEL